MSRTAYGSSIFTASIWRFEKSAGRLDFIEDEEDVVLAAPVAQGTEHSGGPEFHARCALDERFDDDCCEVIWIDELDGLPPGIRRAIEADLDSNGFLPEIVRIHRISSDSTPCEFEVETDRGRTKFTLDSDEQIRKVGRDRLILTDARGVRYHVADVKALDSASRRSLERHL